MMKKHTPGPWTVNQNFENQVITHDGKEICSTFDGKDNTFENQDKEVMEANAVLVSFAPELFRELSNAKVTLEGMNRDPLSGKANTNAPEYRTIERIQELLTKIK